MLNSQVKSDEPSGSALPSLSPGWWRRRVRSERTDSWVARSAAQSAMLMTCRWSREESFHRVLESALVFVLTRLLVELEQKPWRVSQSSSRAFGGVTAGAFRCWKEEPALPCRMSDLEMACL